MTIEFWKTLRRLFAPAIAAGAAFALAGCATTHVGEDWQCPLAQGTQCLSVAAADPAVKRLAAGEKALGALGRGDSERAVRCDGGCKPCGRRCSPIGWFARLFDNDAGSEPAEDGAMAAIEPHEPVPESVPANTTADPGDGRDGTGSSPLADLRSPETIGRVWIAPFVDADGVYREGSWVRIVIAPAAWKRP